MKGREPGCRCSSSLIPKCTIHPRRQELGVAIHNLEQEIYAEPEDYEEDENQIQIIREKWEIFNKARIAERKELLNEKRCRN